jgi:dTMP kinase
MTSTDVPGFFLVFEGGEGSGKSTQVSLLAQRLRASGHDVVSTREPGGTAISEQIRELVLSQHHADMGARCEALLFAAARAEHVDKTIRPALARGAIVICDRFLESSVAYQGAGRRLGMQVVANISTWAVNDVRPDLTILLDIDPETGLSRAQDANRLEAEDLAFHETLRAALLDLAQADPKTHSVISSHQPQPVIAEQVWTLVWEHLPQEISDGSGR